MAIAPAPAPVVAEVYGFLISKPTLEAIIAFRASEALQQRVRELLDANREKGLTPEQEAELDEIDRANDFMAMLKIYARKAST